MADDPSIRTPLEEQRECPICGTYNPPKEPTCNLCGTALSSARAQPRRSQASSQTEQIEDEEPTILFPPISQTKPTPSQAGSTGSNKWMSLVGGAITLLLLFLVSTMFFSGSEDAPKQVAPGFSPTTASSGDSEAGSTAGSAIETGQQGRAALQPDIPDAAAPPPSPTAPHSAQSGGQVTMAEDLLPLQLYGVQENNDTTVRAMVHGRLDALAQQIRQVYDEGLATAPHQSGVVVLEFSLDANGQVSRAAVHATGRITTELQQAIQKTMTQWRFDPTQTPALKVFCPVLLTPSRVEPTSLLSYLTEVWPGRYQVLNATPIPVYAQSNDKAQEIGTIGAGLFVYVISSQDGWLGVLSPTGRVGYVRREHLFPRA